MQCPLYNDNDESVTNSGCQTLTHPPPDLSLPSTPPPGGVPGTRPGGRGQPSASDRRAVLSKAHALVRGYVARLAPAQWLTALSQVTPPSSFFSLAPDARLASVIPLTDGKHMHSF